jgi:hypothetical protein
MPKTPSALAFSIFSWHKSGNEKKYDMNLGIGLPSRSPLRIQPSNFATYKPFNSNVQKLP